MRDQQQFLDVLLPLYERLERFALTMTRNRETARELVAETVAKAYEGFTSLVDTKAFLSYLFTIASRTYYRRLRQHREHDLLPVDEIDELYGGGINPEQAMLLKDLYQAIDELPQEYKEVFVMAEITGLQHSEIAKALSISIANVKVRCHRAKKMLKEQLCIDSEAGEFEDLYLDNDAESK